MSSMAKIFVVANLVLGIFVFGSAATLLGAQDDYKTALKDATEKFAEYRESTDNKIKEIEGALAQQTAKASEQLGRATDAEAARDDLTTRLADSNTANQTLQSTVNTQATELSKANEINAANKDLLDKLAAASKSATEEKSNAVNALDKEIANRVGLEQQVAELTEERDTLAASNGDLSRKITELEFELNIIRAKIGDSGLAPSKGAQGLVNAVKDDLVSISVGSADGVRIGDFYDLSRGAQYVGRIKIQQVDKNLAVGVFDNQFPGSGAPPQRGDKAKPAR
jgi:DNA repair exonuclease SbcCD ATPase subunit